MTRETPNTESETLVNSAESNEFRKVVLLWQRQLKDIQKHLDKGSALLSSDSEILSEELIRLLGERVVVDRNKRKVGEVIVRKVIETRMVQVQVPVRHEKLIVEQVSPERKQLAEIDLGQENFLGLSCPKTLGKAGNGLDKLTDSNA